MKKSVIIILLVLILLVVGTPFYFGIKAENNYLQFLHQFRDDGIMKVEKNDYERGIFSSKANTTLFVNNNSKSIRLEISDKIYHGPFNFKKIIEGNMDPKPFLATAHSDIRADIPVKSSEGMEKTISINMSGNTIIDINQMVDSKIFIPRYKIVKTKGNIMAEWTGMKLDLKYNIKSRHLSSTMRSEFLTVEDNYSTFEIKGVVGTSKAIGHDGKLAHMTGEYEITIDDISYSSKNKSIQLHDTKLSGYSKKDNGKLNSGFKMITSEIDSNGDKFGPFNTEINLNNIDYSAYFKFQRATQSVNKSNPSKAGPNEIMDILPELLKHSPSLEISRLDLESGMGDLRSHAKIKIRGDKPQLLQNIFLIGSAIEAQANIKVSKDLINYFNKYNNITDSYNSAHIENDKIQGLLDNNIITSDDDNFLLSAEFKNGKLTVNNKPLTLTPMLLNMN